MAVIDFLSQKKAAEQRIWDMLAGRPQQIEDQLAATKARIENQRNQYLGSVLQGNLGSLAQGYNLGSIPVDTSKIQRNLASKLNVGQAQQRMGLNQDRVNAIYNQALNMAQDAGYNRQAAEDFARQHMTEEIQRQNEAWSQEFARQQNTRRRDIAENYAQQGLSLWEQYNTPQNDYESALFRILTGLPIQIGTAYALNKYASKDQPYYGKLPMNQSVYPYNPMADINPMLQGRTTFSTNINPMTGRRMLY